MKLKPLLPPDEDTPPLEAVYRWCLLGEEGKAGELLLDHVEEKLLRDCR